MRQSESKILKKLRPNLKDEQKRKKFVHATITEYLRRYAADPKEGFIYLHQFGELFKQNGLDPYKIYSDAYHQNPADELLLKVILEILEKKTRYTLQDAFFFRQAVIRLKDPFPYFNKLLQCYEDASQPYQVMLTHEEIIKTYEKKSGDRERSDEDAETIDWDLAELLYEQALGKLSKTYVDMRKQDGQAEKVYRARVRKDNNDEEAVTELVRILAEQNNTDSESTELYEKYITFHPEDISVQLLLVKCYLEQGREREGLTSLEVLQSQYPENRDILQMLLDLYKSREENAEKYVGFLKKYVTQAPEDTEKLLELAHWYANKKATSKEAADIYKRALEIEPDNETFKSFLKERLTITKDTRGLMELYTTTASPTEIPDEMVTVLASEYLKQKRKDGDTIALYQRAFSLGFEDPYALELVSEYLVSHDRYDKDSADIFRRTLRLNSRDRHAEYGLCRCTFKLNDYSACLERSLRYMFRHGVEKELIEQCGECIAQLPWLDSLDELKRLPGGADEKVLERAYRTNPTNRIVTAELCARYLGEQRTDSLAQEIYAKSLPYNRDNPYLLALLSQIETERGNKEKAFQYDIQLYHICERNERFGPRALKKAGLSEVCTQVCHRLADRLVHDAPYEGLTREICQLSFARGNRNRDVVMTLALWAAQDKDFSLDAIPYYEAAYGQRTGRSEFFDALTKAYKQNNDYEHLINLCVSEIQQDPDSGRATGALKGAIEHISNPSSTVNRAVDALLSTTHLSGSDRQFLQAVMNASKGAYEAKQLDLYEEGHRISPEQPLILLALAKTRDKVGKKNEAIAAYEALFRVAPEKERDILPDLLDLYLKTKARSVEAIERLCRWFSRIEMTPEEYLYFIETLFDLDKKSKALEVVDLAVRTEGDALKGELLVILERCHKATPQDAELSIRLASLLIDVHRIPEAAEILHAVIPQYSVFLGELLDAYSRILKVDPHCAKARFERALLNKLSGHLPEAIEDLEAMEEVADEHPYAMHELAECYERALKKNDFEDGKMLSRLGDLLIRLNECDKCISFFQHLTEVKPELVEARGFLARCFHQKGSLNLALRFYMHLKKDEETKARLYQLAKDLHSEKNYRGTLQALEAILEADIAYRDAAEFAERMRKRVKAAGKTGEPAIVTTKEGELKAIGRYELREKIGEGAMGTIYKAFDRELEEDIALKLLAEHWLDDERIVRRFKQEVRATRRLSHPNIVRVYDIGESEGTRFILMELIEGGDLKNLLTRKTALKNPEALSIACQIAEALSYAHSKGIIHCDVKPSNILLTPEGEVKLTDFGIAGVLSSVSREDSTLIAGTPAYMSPEQYEGKRLTPTSDIYSLGLVMYEMLSGDPPFKGDSLAEQHLSAPPPPLENVTRSLVRIINKCLAKDPKDRYQRMNNLLKVLKTSEE